MTLPDSREGPVALLALLDAVQANREDADGTTFNMRTLAAGMLKPCQ
jgi:hypothetical protein